MGKLAIALNAFHLFSKLMWTNHGFSRTIAYVVPLKALGSTHECSRPAKQKNVCFIEVWTPADNQQDLAATYSPKP